MTATGEDLTAVGWVWNAQDGLVLLLLCEGLVSGLAVWEDLGWFGVVVVAGRRTVLLLLVPLLLLAPRKK